MTFVYQWERCNAVGLDCVAISGATASSYTLGAVDMNSAVQVVVTASNWYGSTAASSDVAGPIVPAVVQPWMSDQCLEDGSPLAPTGSCDTGPIVEEIPDLSDGCQFADGFCDATFAAVQAAGVSIANLQASSTSEQQLVASPDGGASPAALRSSSAASTSSGETGKHGWAVFELLQNSGSNCSGNPVVANGRCGWLWFVWQQYSNGSPTGAEQATRFVARSGGGTEAEGANDPSRQWVVGHGPIPASWHHSSDPSGENYHHWGWQGGKETGPQPNNDPSYYPAFFPIDPYNVYSSSGVQRNSFGIHGGKNACNGSGCTHYYDDMGTNGCIRLRYQSVYTLEQKWKNDVDNKYRNRGPELYVNY